MQAVKGSLEDADVALLIVDNSALDKSKFADACDGAFGFVLMSKFVISQDEFNNITHPIASGLKIDLYVNFILFLFKIFN